jgi:large subunit ribosomal protein L19
MVKIAKKAVDKKKQVVKAEGKAPLVRELKNYPEITPGKLVRVYEKVTESNAQGEEKQRVQAFEGTVIQRKHGVGPNSTITVRKVSDGIGVEKIYPLGSPLIEKIEIKRAFKVNRSKLGFMRGMHKKMKEIK